MPELVVLPGLLDPLMLLKGLFKLPEDFLDLSEPLRLVAPLRSLMLPPRIETLSRSSSTMGS